MRILSKKTSLNGINPRWKALEKARIKLSKLRLLVGPSRDIGSRAMTMAKLG